jgi:hypothetical protein
VIRADQQNIGFVQCARSAECFRHGRNLYQARLLCGLIRPVDVSRYSRGSFKRSSNTPNGFSKQGFIRPAIKRGSNKSLLLRYLADLFFEPQQRPRGASQSDPSGQQLM